MEVLIFFLILWVIFGFFGAWISAQKLRSPVEGAILGFLFGPLGVLIAALLPAGNTSRPRLAHRKRRSSGGREDEVMGFLTDIGGKPNETIDLGAIAQAEEERRRKAWDGE